MSLVSLDSDVKTFRKLSWVSCEKVGETFEVSSPQILTVIKALWDWMLLLYYILARRWKTNSGLSFLAEGRRLWSRILRVMLSVQPPICLNNIPLGTGQVLRTTTQLLPLCSAGKVLLGQLHLWQTDRFAFKPKNPSVVSADRRLSATPPHCLWIQSDQCFTDCWQANIWFYLQIQVF